jgi:hypothetical protein
LIFAEVTPCAELLVWVLSSEVSPMAATAATTDDLFMLFP